MPLYQNKACVSTLAIGKSDKLEKQNEKVVCIEK